jgi:hypothetical protein
MSTHKRTLAIPKAEAVKQLNSQIEEGNKLINRIDGTNDVIAAAVPSVLEELWLDKSRYTHNNKSMLSHMFSDQSVAERFEKFDSRVHFLHDPLAHEKDLEHIKGLVREEVNELRAISEGLQYIPEVSAQEPPTPLPHPNSNQSTQMGSTNPTKTFRQKVEEHPLTAMTAAVLAASVFWITVMSWYNSTRIENEKSKYEAMIETQKRDYESQLRELRTKVKEQESPPSGKNSNTALPDRKPSPTDK